MAKEPFNHCRDYALVISANGDEPDACEDVLSLVKQLRDLVNGQTMFYARIDDNYEDRLSTKLLKV
jgi:hypothetical protein